jgi:hypothetical protein
MAAPKSDVHGLAIVLWGVAFTFVVVILLVWLHNYFFVVRNEVIQKSVLSVPDPRLKELRDQETEELTTYGWTDKETGVVHIPIDRAMDLVAREAARGRQPGPGPGPGPEAATAANPGAGTGEEE